MCDPITMAAATFAVGAGQAISSYVGQKQAYKANVVASNLNFANQYNIEQQKHGELDQQKSENAFDTAIATVRAQGSVAAGAASMGLSQGSIVQALNADSFGIGRQAGAEDTNDANQRVQLSNELQGADIERQSQISKVSKPGLADLALGIGAAGLKGASAYTSAGGKI